MKIYSNGSLTMMDELKIFKQCKAQKLWVRCEDATSKLFGGSGIFYICPDEIRESNSTTFRVAGPSVYADSTDYPISGYSDSRTDFPIGGNVSIAEPLVRLTTEELFGLGTPAAKKPFKRIEGKDVWMLASGPELGWVYVRVRDASHDDYVEIDLIPEYCVHYTDEDSCDGWPSTQYESHQEISWDKIQAAQPPEVLTNDEIYEALEKSDEVWDNQFV